MSVCDSQLLCDILYDTTYDSCCILCTLHVGLKEKKKLDVNPVISVFFLSAGNKVHIVHLSTLILVENNVHNVLYTPTSVWWRNDVNFPWAVGTYLLM